jgi:hypothetical protein
MARNWRGLCPAEDSSDDDDFNNLYFGLHVVVSLILSPEHLSALFIQSASTEITLRPATYSDYKIYYTALTNIV